MIGLKYLTEIKKILECYREREYLNIQDGFFEGKKFGCYICLNKYKEKDKNILLFISIFKGREKKISAHKSCLDSLLDEDNLGFFNNKKNLILSEIWGRNYNFN